MRWKIVRDRIVHGHNCCKLFQKTTESKKIMMPTNQIILNIKEVWISLYTHTTTTIRHGFSIHYQLFTQPHLSLPPQPPSTLLLSYIYIYIYISQRATGDAACAARRGPGSKSPTIWEFIWLVWSAPESFIYCYIFL